MTIDILTIFPNMFTGPFNESIVKRGQNKGLVKISIHNLRDWATDKHNSVDDRPYGGGPGMVLRVDVINRALTDLKSNLKPGASRVVLLSAKGKTFNQASANRLAKLDHLILIAGHYEGVDQRVYDHLVDEVISIGDYVLTGGELPAMVVVDSIVRLLPGVIGKGESLKEESHSKPGYLEYPQYTRPEEYNGWKVPKVLLSGDHFKIKSWQIIKSKVKPSKS